MTASTHPLLSWPPRETEADLRLLTIETEVVVHAPCAAVHAFATNAARWCQWHPATRAVEFVPDRPLGLGETIVEHIATAGRRFSATWTVVAVAAPQLWVIATETPQGLARITYRLSEEAAPGGTTVTRFRRTLEFRSKPALLRRLDPLVRRWVLVPQSRRALDNLKAVVESPARRGATMNPPHDSASNHPRAPAVPHRAATRPLRVIATGVSIVAALYALLLMALWFGQERLLFHPEVLGPTQPLAALAGQPDVHERWVEVPGARLSVLELRLPDPKGVVFFLHGNAGNLDSWFVNTALYREANFDLVMPDYRGYGKSSGRIESEAQLNADVLAVWNEVAPRYQGRKVVFYGRSLGTGLAAALAAQVPPDLTMLVSPYRSMVAVARQHYPWVPAALLRYPLRTDELLGRIRTPLVLIHGERDELIPVAHSHALQAIAPAARLVVLPGAAHGDLQEFDSYRQAVREALQAL